MINEWELKQTPTIVISVLSGVTNPKPFKNPKTTETLKSGIKSVCIDTDFAWNYISNLNLFRLQMHLMYGL